MNVVGDALHRLEPQQVVGLDAEDVLRRLGEAQQVEAAGAADVQHDAPLPGQHGLHRTLQALLGVRRAAFQLVGGQVAGDAVSGLHPGQPLGLWLTHGRAPGEEVSMGGSEGRGRPQSECSAGRVRGGCLSSPGVAG